jgi:TolB-like protein/Tfp pilus assembly protein PilF
VVIIAAVAVWRLVPRTGAPTPADEIPRIVVLPFENLGSPHDEYFASGITDEISSRLAAVSGLQPISRMSARRYVGTDKSIQEIGRELDVGYVLEGTIRWDHSETGHGRVRITPQLIRVTDDSQLWSERYDRVLEDIFTVQSDIAKEVIARLQATLLAPERLAVEARPTDNMEAYQAYLVGYRYYSTTLEEKYLQLAVEMLARAVELDPDFAVAYAALCEADAALYSLRFDFTPERLEMARASAERALALQPDLPEGHRALAMYYYFGLRDYDRALQQFAKAEEGLPNDADVLSGLFYVLRRQGRWDEALQALESWQRVDPQRYLAAVEAANTYRNRRDFATSEKEIRRAITIAPDLADAYVYGCRNYVQWDGTTDRARLALEAAPELDSPDITYQSLLLDLYDRKPSEALARLEETPIDAFNLQEWFVPRALLECVCLSRLSELKRAEAVCASAVEVLEREIDARPHDYRLHIALGRTLAILGWKEEAVLAGEHAVELVPISKDALDGSDQARELAKIYAQVGEIDKALDLIDELLSIPCDLSVGLLRLDPIWDPLRDNLRFQALIEKYDTD